MTSGGVTNEVRNGPRRRQAGNRSDPRASDQTSEPTQGRLRGRRRFLAGLGTVGIGGLAGCSGLLGEDGSDGSGDGSGNETTAGEAGFGEFRGSGPLAEDREELQGTRIADLPDLSGELTTIYLGGGEGGLYRDLLARFQEIYPDFTVNPRASREPPTPRTRSSARATRRRPTCSGRSTPGRCPRWPTRVSLRRFPRKSSTRSPRSSTPTTRGSGPRAGAGGAVQHERSFSADDVPDTVMDFPETEGMASAMGWAPTYGAFQAFVTAMRLIEGEDATRQWLQDMVDAGVSEYNNEFLVSNAVADGELTAGFANHYYALRVQASRPDAPLDLAFTSGDAGALINVAGAAVLGASENTDLANTFLRHLLSAEAQEFFATRTYAYPMVEGHPAGRRPPLHRRTEPAGTGPLEALRPPADARTDAGGGRPLMAAGSDGARTARTASAESFATTTARASRSSCSRAGVAAAVLTPLLWLLLRASTIEPTEAFSLLTSPTAIDVPHKQPGPRRARHRGVGRAGRPARGADGPDGPPVPPVLDCRRRAPARRPELHRRVRLRLCIRPERGALRQPACSHRSGFRSRRCTASAGRHLC